MRIKYTQYLVFFGLVALLVVSKQAKCQQDPMYSQHVFDLMAINPAFCGVLNSINTTAANRIQFSGFEGAPVTQKLTFNLPIQSKYMGVGLRAYNDKLGFQRSTGLMGVYSYHIGVGKAKLSFGVEGGFMNAAIDMSGAIVNEDGDQAISYVKDGVLLPDATFGMEYFARYIYFGASIYHLMGNRFRYDANNRFIQSQLARHYLFNGGFVIPLGEKSNLQPFFFSKFAQGSPMQTEFGLNLNLFDVFAIACSYRLKDGVNFLARFKYKQRYVFGYSYDYTLSALATYSNGSHEIMLAYRILQMPPARDKVIHPRFYF